MFREPRRNRLLKPTLRFTPTAWAKLRFLRDAGPTEVGGFGISADPDDLLCIHDVVLVRQQCTEVTVQFDDLGVAEYFEEQAENCLRPEQIGRVWLHSHPGDSPFPSGVDEETFERAFGQCDWCVMAIIAQNDSTYARIRWRHPSPAEMEIPVSVNYAKPFEGSDHAYWQHEYDLNVEDVSLRPLPMEHGNEFAEFDDWALWGEEPELFVSGEEVAR